MYPTTPTAILGYLESPSECPQPLHHTSLLATAERALGTVDVFSGAVLYRPSTVAALVDNGPEEYITWVAVADWICLGRSVTRLCLSACLSSERCVARVTEPKTLL